MHTYIGLNVTRTAVSAGNKFPKLRSTALDMFYTNRHQIYYIYEDTHTHTHIELNVTKPAVST